MSDPRLNDARWVKSTMSGDTGCVEVAFVDGTIAVRDSKQDGNGPILLFNPHEWDAFLGGARNGEFELDQLSK